jgi:hypothetical protein
MYALQKFATDAERLKKKLPDFSFIKPGYMCECAIPSMRKWMVRCVGKERVEPFFIYLYVEALLQTGIYTYDHANHTTYVDMVGLPLHVCFHGWHGSNPQAVLSAIKQWNETHTQLLQDALSALPDWCKAYDAKFGTGKGKYILQCLSRDDDVFSGWESKLEVARECVRRELVEKFYEKTDYDFE